MNDPQLLRLHDQGLFDDALHVDSSLQGKPQDDWIAALRSVSRREVPRRHSERKKMLAEIPQKLADELAELHSSQAETLRLTNRLEVEEKTAQRWINDLFEKLNGTIPFALECADWRDRYFFNDAKATAERALRLDPNVQNSQSLIESCSSINITRRLGGLSMNMREVKITESVEIVVANETMRTSFNHSETAVYAWQSDRWVLKNPGGYSLLAEILPDEVR